MNSFNTSELLEIKNKTILRILFLVTWKKKKLVDQLAQLSSFPTELLLFSVGDFQLSLTPGRTLYEFIL